MASPGDCQLRESGASWSSRALEVGGCPSYVYLIRILSPISYDSKSPSGEFTFFNLLRLYIKSERNSESSRTWSGKTLRLLERDLPFVSRLGDVKSTSRGGSQ